MIRALRGFMARTNSKNVLINTVGNYLNVAFTAFFAIILVRIMSPAEYGVLSVLLGIAYVLANVLDFGVTATIYSSLPTLLENRSQRIYGFIKTIFTFQSVLSLIAIALLLVGFPTLDKIFFKTEATIPTLYITTFSILFLIWQNFALNILFAAKKFLMANIYNNLQNVIKTIILLFMIAHGTVTVGAVLFIFGVVGPAIFFLLLFIKKRDLIFILVKSKVKRAEVKAGYTFTYFFATQLFNLGGRMDLFLLSFFGLKNIVGYYGLSQKIILSIVTTVISVTQVLSPNFARVTNKKEALHELKNGFFYLLIPTGLFILLLLTPRQVFDLFFTQKFAQTAAITKSLVPAFIIFTLGSLPLQFILYTAKKPVYVLWGNILYFLIMTAGSYLLIPPLKAGALPVINLLAILAPVSILSIATVFEYRKLPA